MTKADWTIEGLKFTFLFYAFVAGQALYHSHYTLVCQAPHFVAASVIEHMTLRELTQVEIVEI